MFTPNLPDPVADEVAEASRGSKGCLLGFLYTVGLLVAVVGAFLIASSETNRGETISMIVVGVGVLLLITAITIHLKPEPRSSGLLDGPMSYVEDDASTAERLAELQGLLDDGLITQEEFQSKRQEILDQI